MKSPCRLHLAVSVLLAVHLLLLQLRPCEALITKRCQSVCSRSDGQDFCQRCRMRVPMRFGKRTDAAKQHREDEDSGQQQQTDDGSSSENDLKKESRAVLASMRNFVRDLEDWNRDFYDQ